MFALSQKQGLQKKGVLEPFLTTYFFFFKFGLKITPTH